jgi:hypothetical protein
MRIALLVIVSFAAGVVAPFEISETVNAAPTRVLSFRILQKGQPATTNVE